MKTDASIHVKIILALIFFHYGVLNTEEGKNMKLSSLSFSHNEPLDKKFTKYAENRPPQVSWDSLPAGTKSLALIVDDPDAPTSQPWVHAVIYNINPEQNELKEGDWSGGTFGQTDFQGETGYQGPKPPKGHGVHRYFFKLYALDSELKLPQGKTKSELEDAMKGKILATAEIVGTFEAV